MIVRLVLASSAMLLGVSACMTFDDTPVDSPKKMDVGVDDCGSIKGFAFIRDTVLPQCSGSTCHSSGNERGLVVLEPKVAYANLVGVPSGELPSMKFVEPNLASRSYVYRKMSGTQANACDAQEVPPATCGDNMPLNSWDSLPADWPEELRKWIVCGAKP